MPHNPQPPDLHSGGSMLAQSDRVSVYHCSCGSLHLQIGAVCLTMSPEDLTEVGAVVLRALGQLPPRATPTTTIVN